jgi:Tfp pilus assembly protein FimT
MASPNLTQPRQSGFLSLEILLALSIIAVFICLAVPNMVWHRQHYAVDALAREMMLDLQWVRQNSLGNGLGGTNDLCLSIRNSDYRIVFNNYIVRKKRSFGGEVYVPAENQRKDFRFDEQGKPKGKKMQFTIRSRDKQYERRVIIAAQTGRIRIE